MSDLPPPARPYRAAAIFHAALALVIVLFAALTGGSLPKAAAFAIGYFVVATAWSWFRFRQRRPRTAPSDAGPSGNGRP